MESGRVAGGVCVARSYANAMPKDKQLYRPTDEGESWQVDFNLQEDYEAIRKKIEQPVI